MLFNVVHGQVQKKLTKTYNKGFPNHSTLINRIDRIVFIIITHSKIHKLRTYYTFQKVLRP